LIDIKYSCVLMQSLVIHKQKKTSNGKEVNSKIS
jgi:hypothetical protein